jgi:hypothetical protein
LPASFITIQTISNAAKSNLSLKQGLSSYYHVKWLLSPLSEQGMGTVKSSRALYTSLLWHILPEGGEEFLEELGYGCTGIGDAFAHAFIKDYYNPELNMEKGKVPATEL